MPEGDTIYRTARTLTAAIAGEPVERAETRAPRVADLGVHRLEGQVVARVEPRGKHLLHWFAPSGLALHTHMGMTGSWHLYRHGDRWRKPPVRAWVVLTFPQVVAVCFTPMVCELLGPDQVARHPSLAGLGPDALQEGPGATPTATTSDDETRADDDADDDPDAHTSDDHPHAPGAPRGPVDLAEARQRLDAREAMTAGEALLDQRVLAGVGNVYKNEVLFIHGVDPWARVGELAEPTRDALLATATRLLRANVADGAMRRTTTGSPVEDRPGRREADRLHVYGKPRQPCPRCGTPIRVARQGSQARPTYWCPRCQGPGPDRGRGGTHASAGPAAAPEPRPRRPRRVRG